MGSAIKVLTDTFLGFVFYGTLACSMVDFYHDIKKDTHKTLTMGLSSMTKFNNQLWEKKKLK